VDAGALTALVDVVLPRAWRRESPWHGEEHWRCVTTTALALAETTANVDRTLVFCFGLFHDTRRENEHVDPPHGTRAATFAEELRAEGILPLGDRRFARLAWTLTHHSDGLVSDDPTTGVCWDADRLHLPRVSIVPRPDLFSTPAAHGEAPLAEAEKLRSEGPPTWPALVAVAGR
jgi:uncharacterized protein